MSKRKQPTWEEAEETAIQTGKKIFHTKETGGGITVYIKKKFLIPFITKCKWHNVIYEYNNSNHRYERGRVFLKYWQKMMLTIMSLIIGYLIIYWNDHATIGSYLLGVLIAFLIPIITYKIVFRPIKKADKYVKEITK